MNIEEIRHFALSINSQVTEKLFADKWLSWRICDKWFLLTELDTSEPRVSVKLSPEDNERLREQYDGVRPAYHMNKKHWSDLILDQLDDDFIRKQILSSYALVVSKLPKKIKENNNL